MLQVESAVACDVGVQQFEMWAHHWVPSQDDQPGRAMFNKFTLLPRADQNVRQTLDLPQMEDPFAMFGLAENNPEHARRLRELGQPIVTSLVQVCNRSSHSDHLRTPRGNSRSEVMHRIIWMPQDAMELKLAHASMEIDQRGVGRARLADGSRDIVPNVLSAPLTARETEHARMARYGRLVLARPADSGSAAVYVALHPRLDNDNGIKGPILERFYRSDPERFALAA